MENQSKERRLLQTKLSTSVFGSKFKVSRFTSFLSWTGMILCVMMMIVSLALLTIPNDLKKKHPRFVDDPKDFEGLNLLWFTMYGVGAALMKKKCEEGCGRRYENSKDHLLCRKWSRTFDHLFFGCFCDMDFNSNEELNSNSFNFNQCLISSHHVPEDSWHQNQESQLH